MEFKTRNTRLGPLLVLENIKRDRTNFKNSEIYKMNLAAAPDPNHPEYKPEHMVLVFIDDPAIRDQLSQYGFAFRETEFSEKNENGEITDRYIRYSLKLKVYPNINPSIMYRTTNKDGKYVNHKLDIDRWGEIDAANLQGLDIHFHPYPTKYGNIVPSINQVWATSDQSQDVLDDEYFANKYGIYDDDDEEEMPFK